MAAVKHAFTSTKGASTDATKIGGNNWNASHVDENGDALVVPGITLTQVAATNVSRLQAALNDGGIVSVLTPGTYPLNATLVIYDDTALQLALGVEFSMSDSSNVCMLKSSQIEASTTAVTLTWSSGMTCSVAWTAHGMTVNDFVWLLGADQYQYIGVFQVTAVADADNFTVALERLPTTSPTGTTVAKSPNRNIYVSGGLWNYNYTGNPSAAAGYDRHCIVLAGENVHVNDCQFVDTYKFCVNLGAVTNFSARNIRASDSTGDQVKVYGPAYHGTIEGVHCAASTDDVVSCQTEEPSAFAAYKWTYGDIVDIRISRVHCAKNTAGQFVELFSSPNGYVDNVVIDGVTGQNTSTSVAMSGGSGMASANFGKITVSNVTAKAASASVQIQAPVIMDEFILNNFTVIDTTASNNSLFQTAVGSNVKKITINNMYVNAAIWGNASAGNGITLSGTCDQIDINNPQIIAGGSLGHLIRLANGASNSTTTININQGRIRGCEFLLQLGASLVVTPTVNITDVDMQGTTCCVVDALNSAAINFRGGRYANATNGMVRTTGTVTLAVREQGVNLVSGSWFTTVSGTPVITLYGWGITVDPIALTGLATTAGQFFNSNRATAINQGPSIRSAAGWVALGTGASGVNTVIT